MLDFFYNNNFDNEIVLRNNCRMFSKKELKQLVQSNLDLVRNKKENVILIPNDNLSFIINFFASIFTNKNIYLIDSIQKIKNLENFDVLENAKLDISNTSFDFSQIDQDKVLVHLMTSGSSGAPKDIVKSLTNIITEVADISAAFDFGKDQLVVSSTTIYSHMFGLTFGLIFPLCNHHIINLEIVEYPDKFKIENSMLVSTPSFLDIVKKNNIILDNAKFIVTAGAKLNDKTFEYLEEYSKVIEIYGSSETGVIAHKETSKSKSFTPFKNVSVTALEDAILIRTPYAYQDEVLISDKIEFVNGQIFLQNRTDRLLKIQEKRISAEHLEKELNSNSLVFDSYCFKFNDKIACICALTSEGQDFLLKNGIVNIVKYLKSHLKNKFVIIPQKWKFIDEIPKNKAGKIDKVFINRIFGMNASFPIILDRTLEENSVTLKLYFYKNCNFYNGHFPEYPITPGVAQLYFASFLGEYFFNKELVGGQIRRIKFSNIIKADEIVNLRLKLNEASTSFEYLKEDKMFSSGVFSCQNVFKGV